MCVRTPEITTTPMPRPLFSLQIGSEHIVLVVLVALTHGDKHLSEHIPPSSPVFTGLCLVWFGENKFG